MGAESVKLWGLGCIAGSFSHEKDGVPLPRESGRRAWPRDLKKGAVVLVLPQLCDRHTNFASPWGSSTQRGQRRLVLRLPQNPRE